jgi:cell division protein FtsI (penicillin-binding protein 3)
MATFVPPPGSPRNRRGQSQAKSPSRQGQPRSDAHSHEQGDRHSDRPLSRRSNERSSQFADRRSNRSDPRSDSRRSVARSPRADRLDPDRSEYRSDRRSPRRPARMAEPGLFEVGLKLFGRKLRSSSRYKVEPTRSRLITVWAILMVGMVGLSLNLLRLQIFQAPSLQQRAQSQQLVSEGESVPRRPIVDRSGNLLAIDEPMYTLFAHPYLFKSADAAGKTEVATAIAPLLNLPPETLIGQFNSADSGIRLKDQIDEETAKKLKALRLDGLEFIQQQQRLYPRDSLFANIVGYVNDDRQGQAGVELMLEERLKRAAQNTMLSRTGEGDVIPRNLPPDFFRRDEMRMQLTVDTRLQKAAMDALQIQMDAYEALRGAVIVMDVRDGSILALASAPTYNPNEYYKVKDVGQLRNWVLTDLYEPGSTFKPINVAIALDSGAVKPDDYFYDEGAIQIDEWTIANNDFESEGGRGDLSLSEILQYSSNVGMVRLMQRMQPGVYYGWLQRLGLDRKTEVDLPAEAAGQGKSYAQFTGAIVEPATTSFGQGFSLTPIKLLQLHAMLGNGGKLVTPHVVKGLVDPTGELRWTPDRPAPKQIFSPKTTDRVLRMMEDVVAVGTGKPAIIPSYRIGGKTGTAQKASPQGGYIPGARITSFVSVFPVDQPRYAVLAVIDEPQGKDAYGSTVAAPIVKSVMESLITSEQIPPSQYDEP